MTTAIEQVTEILVGAGFQTKGSYLPGLGISFVRAIENGWMVGAHATTRDDLFDRCDLYLHVKSGEHSGTEYRVRSIETLRREIAPTIQKLVSLASDEELLRCPKCKTRRVTVKERNSDGSPFLSCEGASMLHGSGRNKAWRCDGISRLIPARIELT